MSAEHLEQQSRPAAVGVLLLPGDLAAARTAWDLAEAADLALPCVSGHRSFARSSRYVRRLQAAASHDAAVAAGFLRVVGLVDRPTTLLRPSIVGPTLRPRLKAHRPKVPWLQATTVRLAVAALALPVGAASGAALVLVSAVRRHLRTRRGRQGIGRSGARRRPTRRARRCDGEVVPCRSGPPDPP